MFWMLSLVASLVLGTSLVAQDIPEGTSLPIMLNSGIDAGKATAGATIKGRLMQDVKLPSGVRVPAGATVLGSVVELTRPGTSSGSRLAIKFDSLVFDKRTVHFSSHLRALASMNEVFEAQLPTNAIDDYGTSIADWNTVQVGDSEGVYRGDGTIVSANQVVGSATVGSAVQAKLQAVRDGGCHASAEPQALWVFSTTACGVYGYADIVIAHRGATSPIGEIVLTSKGKLRLQGGGGLLLITN